MAKIYVKGTGTDNRVILWEKDDRHPGGEVFVVNDGASHEVYKTTSVVDLLANGSLKETDEKPASVIKVAPNVSPLRPATEQEKEDTEPPLEDDVEEETAEVPVTNYTPLNRGGRPVGSKNKVK